MVVVIKRASWSYSIVTLESLWLFWAGSLIPHVETTTYIFSSNGVEPNQKIRTTWNKHELSSAATPPPRGHSWSFLLTDPQVFGGHSQLTKHFAHDGGLMTKRKSLIDWWGGETHPKTTTLCYYSCRELLDEGFFCFHHDCFKDDQPAMKCSPVPHVTRILFQDSRSCMSYVGYCWCQAFLIKASITSELIHYGNVGKQNPVYKSLHTTCFWQRFLVRLLLKALEVLRTAEFAGKFVWRIVFIAWFQFSLFTLLIIAKGEPWRLESRLSA